MSRWRASPLVKGMTCEYTVSVLAPDGHTFARYRYTVTYITPATHSSRLTGIKVSGKPISGFDPARLSYDVSVADVNRWTIVPQYDRTLGVTVDDEPMLAETGSDVRGPVTAMLVAFLTGVGAVCWVVAPVAGMRLGR